MVIKDLVLLTYTISSVYHGNYDRAKLNGLYDIKLDYLDRAGDR